MFSSFPPYVLVIISIFVIALIVFWYLSNIKIFRPDQLVSINSHERHIELESGEDLRVRSRIIKGGGSTFINPFTQSYHILSTNINFITIPCEGILTQDDLAVTANATLTYSIDDSSEESIRKAFSKFGKYSQTGLKGINSEKKISEIISKMLEVGIRDIVGKMNAEELKSDSEGFAKKAQQYIELKLEPLGLLVHAAGVKNINYLDEEFERKRKESKNRQMIEESNKTRELERKAEKEEKKHQAEMKLEDLKQQFKYDTESKIKAKESEKDLRDKEQEIEKMEEKHRIQISSLKKERLDAEEGVLAKEEESTQNLLLIKERSKATVDKIIAEINAETAHIKRNSNGAIEYYNAQLQRDIELMQAYTRFESLKAEALGQEKLIGAMNNADTGAIIQVLLRQNPELIENILEKLLGENGFSGIAEGITKHLGNIESLRIADLGGGSGSSVEKLAELPVNILVKLLAGMSALDLGEILEKLGLPKESFNNLSQEHTEDYDEKNLKKKSLSEISQVS